MKNSNHTKSQKIESHDFHRLSDAELFGYLKEKKNIAEPAFGELYARHSPRIYAYCRCVFGDTEQSKDIFQETFMRFYESAQKERVMTNVPAFLLIIARNLCLNVKRQTKELLNVEDFQIPQRETPPEQTEMLQLITMAMELLPDDYRETFFLRDFEDMSYSEISKVLKIPEVTVRVRVSRARQKIREILQPYLVELAQ